ncbi:ribonuclease H-like domain-containing protein [Tanacetum coccineum]
MLLRPHHAGFGKPNTVVHQILSRNILTLMHEGNLQQKEYKEKGLIESGCSRHMTGNKCYLTEYEDYNGVFVSFEDGKDETVHKKRSDRIESAATTASSLEAERDSFYEPPLSRVNTLGSKEDNMKLKELMELCTKLSDMFWATANAKTFTRERHIQALVEKKKIIITESTIRQDLLLKDKGGTDCLPTAVIFEELVKIGAKTTAWNEFSSTMASAIICLATNQKFNFSKYIFDNMGKDFFGRITPLFQTMMVQAQQAEGESSEIPTDSIQTPIPTQPSTSQPQKQKSKKSKKKNTKVHQLSSSPDDVADAYVTYTFNDPPQSGEDRMQLTELMDLYTKLSDRVLALKNIKTTQALEIKTLKRRVKKLEKKASKGTHKLKRLYKFGLSAKDIYEDEDISLKNVQETDTFRLQDLDGDEVFVEIKEPIVNASSSSILVSTAELVTTAGKVVTTASAPTTTMDELTLAQTLIEIKAAKPKAITTAATTVTSASTRLKAKGIVFHDKEEQALTLIKEQIRIDEELARQLEAEEQEAARLEREEAERQEEATIALIESWNNTQAMMEADRLLAERLQVREQEELTDEEKARLFVELFRTEQNRPKLI